MLNIKEVRPVTAKLALSLSSSWEEYAYGRRTKLSKWTPPPQKKTPIQTNEHKYVKCSTRVAKTFEIRTLLKCSLE